METKLNYRHIRSINTNGPKPTGGATVAYTRIRNSEDQVVGLKISVAACTGSDRYCRAVGRRIATGRYNAGKVCLITVSEADQTFEDTLRLALAEHTLTNMRPGVLNILSGLL